MTSLQPPITPMVPPLVGDRPALLRRFPLIFLAFTPLALFLDSAGLARQGLELRWLVNGMALLCFATLFAAADRRLKRLLAVMVPLSYVGELIFCEALGWYHYRLNDIPLYVPLGHAIVYGAGYVAAHHRAVLQHDEQVQRACSAAFASLFLGVCLLLGDYFSGLSGLLFFWLIRRKQWQNLYFMIALCVIYIELLGTAFGCWTWAPKIHGYLATANPPMGAVFFYAGGDSLLARIVNGLDRRAAASSGTPAWRFW